MERKRKNFGYLTTKVYGGKPDDKTVAIHFEPKDTEQAIRMARAILQAVEHGKGVNITIFRYRLLKDGTVPISITAPK